MSSTEAYPTPGQYPRGVDLEVWEKPNHPDRVDNPLGVIVPNAVRINGLDVLVPSGTDDDAGSVIVHPMTDRDAVIVTVTMFARRIVVAAGVPPEPDEGADPIFREMILEAGIHPMLHSRLLAKDIGDVSTFRQAWAAA